ncbi:hypothetical protein DPMN_162480 [Dreissena polymorpha]|uniref:Dipeptidase n=1 Tax=Dreissena polymorpha TaxID=45954 RepID=A0A9D4ERQ9_DREPO|nr:hypothetical protein DPMN_162480 [Dreissena polymorpha]
MSDNRSPDLSFENEADGLLVESSASLLDVSLRLHDYGRFTPVPAIIRHQCEQVQPELISVVTQTDDTRVPRSISTQTSTETSTVGIQVDRPSFTFEDIRDDDDKVLFYTDHIEYIKDLIGVDHVGIGSDYDGADIFPVGLENVSFYPELFAELVKRGWSDIDLQKLAGRNVIRVFHEVEKSRSTGNAELRVIKRGKRIIMGGRKRVEKQDTDDLKNIP